MRVAVALLVLLWSSAAAAQQYGQETRAPVPSGGPPPTGAPPPPGVRAPEGIPEPPSETERFDDPAAPPPAVAPPTFVEPVDVAARPAVPPPGTGTDEKPAKTSKTAAPNVVRVYKDQNGYVLLVDGKPTMVLGMNWGYMPIGENYTTISGASPMR